ncbi:polyketide synthase dehydratase domain-containing protein [Penicillium taxi]|uniref:polyketide synthase dehydratase domain-containing protein n=1 Tax=Penicillium taxi TaxID=168475 RepID=UPI0025452F08|nr:polyketide synthase dehydratase domain-containing protein [Penicillium taxi]KAJ5887819.1 polyketide synthase dehydratase domain-containing protein [Penicillium taxi]
MASDANLNVKEAFREMQHGSHIGKLVLRFTTESRASIMPPNMAPLSLKLDATYLRVGGLGGLRRPGNDIHGRTWCSSSSLCFALLKRSTGGYTSYIPGIHPR